jgi:hypothetical protein
MTGFAPRASFRRQRFYRTNRGRFLTENTCAWLNAFAAGACLAVFIFVLMHLELIFPRGFLP